MNENELNNNQGEEKKSDKKRILLIVFFLIIFICSCVYIGFYLFNNYQAGKEYESSSTVQTTTQGVLADNPIDFQSLQSQNDEIYAWIKIDDTEVDYPIVQSKTDDEFYLKHSALDKKWLASGAIYTEGCNRTDFSDPITVIYGHNGYKETMFTTLHKFEDAEFFNSHEYFYIYMPGRKLTYQIISAFKYDDRHIMNSFNFQSNDTFREFIEMIQNPNSTNKNVRKVLDKEITIQDNIVVLSTCITGQKSNRYLVCGVLVKNEKTN